ncbi:MAG: DUF3883 domain-containing protein, partial [Candidatus Bathyarchaeia archaeon]
MLKEKKERKAFRRVTEYKAIQAFIREGRGGLERLVERILAARREIEKELRSKSVLYMPKTREEAERAPGALGFSSPSKLIESFKSLVKSAAPILGITVDESGEGTIRAAKGFEMPKALTTLDDFFGILYAKGRMATVISYGEHEDTLLLVNLKALYDSTTLYSEPIGVYLTSGRIIRGADLLTEVSTALSRCIGAAEGGNPGLPLNLKALIASRIRGSLSSVLSPLTNYRDGLVRSGLRDQDSWADEHEFAFEITEPFGCIRFVKEPVIGASEPPEEVKREVEEEAVKFALKVEADEGRIAVIVPESEHYDIRSIDPKTGEVRKIEVKGHAGPEIYAELTDDEAELARREGDNYWLYIVYNVKSGSPKLLRF